MEYKLFRVFDNLASQRKGLKVSLINFCQSLVINSVIYRFEYFIIKIIFKNKNLMKHSVVHKS
jgi:hypothetical protein